MSVPLYVLADQFRQLQLLATDEDVDAQTLADTLEAIKGEIDVKAVNVAKFISNLDADAEAIEHAAKQMQARAARLRHRAEAVRTYLLINMTACAITKISCPWFTIRIVKNPPRVDVIAGDFIPDRFLVWPEAPPPAIDKRALLAALKAGEEIPGAVLAQDERVEIKT